MKIIKWLLILCILLNIMLIFSNIFNTSWTIKQIDAWLESPTSPDRLINQEALKNTLPITINGEVKAVIEVESTKKN